jgi:hypothetical protein
MLTEQQMYIESIAKYYKYKKLSPTIGKSVQRQYKESIKPFLVITGSNTPLYDKYGTQVCKKYSRIVIGDYGAYVEFSQDDIFPQNIQIKHGQEYRIYDDKYSKNVKYHYYTTKNKKEDVKIYFQVRLVDYADYKPGLYYISTEEVFSRDEIYSKKSRKNKREKLKQNI